MTRLAAAGTAPGRLDRWHPDQWTLGSVRPTVVSHAGLRAFSSQGTSDAEQRVADNWGKSSAWSPGWRTAGQADAPEPRMLAGPSQTYGSR